MKSIICLLFGISSFVFGTEYEVDPLTDEYYITEITGPYKMGTLITCYEQNDQTPYGYKDKIYSDEADKETGEISEMCLDEHTKIMCDRYKDESYPEPGRGDVCDHTDPRTGVTRNACYFNTIYGPVVNDEKTWSYKCWEISQCPLKDEVTGLGREGCQVTNRRINCCCQQDYCNGGELIEKFAEYGNPDKYPPDYQEICDIDFSKYGVYVKFNIPSWSQTENDACTYDPDAPTEAPDDYFPSSEEDTTEEPEDGGYGDDENEDEEEEEEEESDSGEDDDYDEDTNESVAAAQAQFFEELTEESSKQSQEMVNMADIVLVFSYFIIGIVCLGIGVFIGTKWKTSVMQQQMMIKNQQLDI